MSTQWIDRVEREPKTKKRRQRIYAVYDDDVFVDIGTKHELAERLGVLANSITFMASPSYKKENLTADTQCSSDMTTIWRSSG